MFEVEVKVRIPDVAGVRSGLLGLGAVHHLTLEQRDTYFDDRRHHLAGGDQALRLRVTREYSPGGEFQREHADVSYKGPKLDQVSKTRVEHVAGTPDPVAMRAILVGIGFTNEYEMVKRRELYTLTSENTPIEFLVDRVEGLPGYFLEAEIVVPEASQMADAQRTLWGNLHPLGFTEADSIRESYLELHVRATRAGT
jgi:adenylate cyclase class 2